MVPKTRLGKRSPLGALVSSACLILEGAPGRVTPGDQEVGVAGIATATGPGPHAIGRIRLHPGLKVCFQCEQQHNMEEDAAPPPSRPHPVSSCIDVPRSHRSADEVDMDEMMAAMVLSSLSCSPLLHTEPAVSGMECGGSELSDSGSSGYWSVGHGNRSPTPSPPITEPDGGLATPSDEGLDMELEQVLFDEPAPRKRRNSVKVAFSCLWPSCGKVLTSVVGIKRHVRTVHLGVSGEHSEEDFYYTEIQQRDKQPLTPPPTPLSPAPLSICPASSPGPPPPPVTCGPLGGGCNPPTDGTTRSGTLSSSAPPTSDSFWQVQSEHSYQAPPPVDVVSPAAPPTAAQKQGLPFRVRSLSVGEQWLQQHSTPIRTLPASVSPPRCHWPARRVRGEAKKCRKVYGIEHRDQWCTACRWKKACQRFLD